jgi:RsiW-degrading membrane proteinase PrsW (M82 family)
VLFEPQPENGPDAAPHRSGLSPDLRGSAPVAIADEGHASEFPRPGILGLAFTVVVALIGGLFGIVGAGVQELRTGGFILLPILGAPIIEEGLKPIGVYLLQARWPQLLLGRLHTGILGGLAGLTFGVLEALVYVFVYVDDPSDSFVLYRFTAPLALHTFCSFLVGLGVTRQLISWANGENPLPKSSRNLYLTAVAIHAAFNTTAIVLSLAGLIDFD